VLVVLFMVLFTLTLFSDHWNTTHGAR
jgi:hypothetical protein